MYDAMVLVFGCIFFLFAAKMGRSVCVRQIARKAVLSYTVIHILPVSAAHVQSSKNNRFCRYYVIFGRNDRSASVGKIPVFMRKYQRGKNVFHCKKFSSEPILMKLTHYFSLIISEN